MTTKPGQRLFVSHIDYGDAPSQAPSERVRELHGESDDINYQYGGNAAAVGFEIVIQGGADGSLKDLVKGAGGDFRYVLPIRDVTQEAKDTQVALLRLDGDLGRRPSGWSGNTMDINKNRGKTFLYLLWKTAV